MQLKLTKLNEQRLKELVAIYHRICPEYKLSPTNQGNLLLSGRLTVAISEAEKELKKKPCKKCKA